MEHVVSGFAFLFSRIFATRPVLSKKRGRLIAQTSLKSKLLCLGFGSRKLEVDPARQAMRLTVRDCWVSVSTRFIRFAEVREVIYRYAEMAPSWGAYQEADLFTVELRLHSGEIILLFRFFGQGDFVNNTVWPDWMYWDDFLVANYTRGDQENESLLFVDLLCRMLNVPMENE